MSDLLLSRQELIDPQAGRPPRERCGVGLPSLRLTGALSQDKSGRVGGTMLTQCVMLHVMRMGLLWWQPPDLCGMGCVVIVGFKDRANEAFYRGDRVASFSGFAQTASRKLNQLDAATGLEDLARSGNRLEPITG